MVCCWFWPSPPTSSSKKKKKKASKANTSAPRRGLRPASYTSAEGTPLLAPRPAATSSLYSRNDAHYTTTSNNKRVRVAHPNAAAPPSPKKPKTRSKHDSSSSRTKLQGRGTKRGPPRPHPDPHPCASCALHHPGHSHRTSHHHHHSHHHRSPPAAAPDPYAYAYPSLRRSTGPLPTRAGYTYGTGPVYSSSSSHHASPPGRAHARPNTSARRGARRGDAPIIDVGGGGGAGGYAYAHRGPVAYGAVPMTAGEPGAFAVRAATNQALERVRRQAFREQQQAAAAAAQQRPAGPVAGRRVQWADGRGVGGYGSGGRRGFPPYGGLERWL
ncbi:hypothetical protein GTA08_BOTSDO09518 [Neofusicoccum parvum]|nr:hypothetical protein GTA08_BOTSDO09518 [Neofusicoccum parvum]